MSGSVGAYIGPDRRQRMPVTVQEPNRRLLITMAVAVFLYGAVVPTVIAEILGSGRSFKAATVATIVCTILFAQGGLLCLLRWRLTGDGWSFQLGMTGLVYGFFVAPLAEVFDILAVDASHQVVLQTVAQSVVGVVAAVFAAKAAVIGPIDSRLRFGRSMALAAGALLALSAMGYVAYRVMPSGTHHLFSALVAAAAAAAWTAAAAALLWRGRTGKLVMSRLLSAPLLVLGLGSIASALAVQRPIPFSLDASALTMSAGILFALGGGYALLTTLSDQGASIFRLRAMLRNLEQYQAREEERTHDARSALSAIQTAITALTRYREHLDNQSRTNLELAVDSELDRLLGLMASPSPAAHAVDCRPFDVVRPVLAVATAATAFGMRIELDVPEGGCWAVGNRDDTARVLETLLDNARHYAPGSPISVQVCGDAEAVRVVVADRGPGIAPEERDVVFQRGRRGRASNGTDGSGLGLCAARRLMEDQEGALDLARTGPPGATFVVTLRAAERSDPVAVAGDRERWRGPRRPPAPRPLVPPAPTRTLVGEIASGGPESPIGAA